MILFTLEEFTARRKKAQTDIEDRLRDEVERSVDIAMDTSGWEELLDLVADVYEDVYFDESGDRQRPPEWLHGILLETLRKTKDRDENSVERITVWLATAILAVVTIEASIADPEELFLEWVTMLDKDVRDTHEAVHGQVRPIGDKYNVGGHEMRFPGDPTVPIELWINCRCQLFPTLASEFRLTAALSDNATHPSGNTSTCLVALPAEDSDIHQVGEEPKHVTLAYLGEIDDDDSLIQQHAAEVAGRVPGPFTAAVSGHAVLGPDKAKVLLVEAQEFNDLRNQLLESDEISLALEAADSHPHHVPHVTITYGDAPPEITEFTEITFDRLAVWHRDEHTDYPLGEAMTDTVTEPEVDQHLQTSEDAVAVPWHGILAPEGVPSGDGRMFAANSLRMRDLPLPLTWQKASGEGHAGSVTVAKIEAVERRDGLIRASGYFLATPEADEVVGLLAEFGRFGVSVDADDATAEIDEENEMVVFTSARIASASIVAIPAFAEAYVALGIWPEDDEEPEEKELPTAEPVDEEEDEELVASFKDLAPGKTEDGPGWLTHPVDTDRLRDYWVRGPGAAKIAWGTPGDFNRCRLHTAEYVKPQYLNGYCANRHYDALGFWPGRHSNAGDTLEATGAGEALTLVAAIGNVAPASWFTNPELSEATPLTVSDEGRVFGHLAAWGTCHLDYPGVCVDPPHSATGYAHFLTGEVALDDGTRTPVGPLTIGGGHAAPGLSARGAKEHYDSTSSAVADVTVGEDEFGIWFSGWVRPGVSDDMVSALMASPPSGDWRKSGGSLELIAALSVNSPGFLVPRVRVAATAQGQMSLVAAGAVAHEPAPITVSAETIANSIAESVAALLEQRQARREKMASLAARVGG